MSGTHTDPHLGINAVRHSQGAEDNEEELETKKPREENLEKIEPEKTKYQ